VNHPLFVYILSLSLYINVIVYNYVNVCTSHNNKPFTYINNTSQLETYCLLKHTFGFEEYLDFMKDRTIRISLTQFRVSSHDLNIEVGRYTDITRNQQLGTNCSMNILECEYHVLLVFATLLCVLTTLP